ncbi:MAG: hypothetical protein U0798_21645 [Gemmataceae bacterium]
MIAVTWRLIAGPFHNAVNDRSLLRTICGVVALAVVCFVVAHGCHAGGHDLDLEP